MIIIMQPGAAESHIEGVIEKLSRHGFDVHRVSGEAQVVIGAIGVKPEFDARAFESLDGVAEVHRVTQGYRFASRLWKPDPTVVEASGVAIGRDAIAVLVAPEPEDLPEEAAAMARQHGALLYGGARTGRESMKEHLERLRTASGGAAVAVEVVDVDEVDLAAEEAALLIVGAERMGHLGLLRALGLRRAPVVLYRSPSATVEEWLTAADIILGAGNPNVVLCESGLRTFETTTRRTLDLSAIPALRTRSHLPILVDPSQGTGQPRKVAAMARAAVAAGADGVIVELHADADFSEMMAQIHAVAQAVGRR